MIDLRLDTLKEIPERTSCFSYDRSVVTPGIVHLSVGNFHRAHQAWYMDQVLEAAGLQDWGIVGVGLIDDATERLKLEAFPAQDDLYTLTRYAADGSVRHQIIGSIIEYIFAPGDPEAVLRRMASPEIRIVTMTITEGGYNQDPESGTYRLGARATQAELAAPATPSSAFGYIVEALRRRREAGTQPFTVLSCDNLRNNGAITRRAVIAHATALDSSLGEWVEKNVMFPNSMVDRITPAVLKEDADRVNAECGVHDRLPIISEDYVQWVIEDNFCNARPPFEQFGVRMTDDVHPYELAKVRMLNASHSMLAYPGQLAGLESVKDAVDNPLIHHLVLDFMTQDVMPLLTAPEGMDLEQYRDKILARFGNPHVGDRLARITGDGRSKLPTFLLPTLAALRERGAPTDRIAFVLACFLQYLAGATDGGDSFEPFEPHLTTAERVVAADPIKALTSLPMFSELALNENDPLAIRVAQYVHALREMGVMKTLATLIE